MLTLAAANQRLNALAETFGTDNEIYQTADDYISERLDEKYLVRDDQGTLVRIKQSKDIKAKPWGKSTSADEYIPTVRDVIKKEMGFLKEELEDRVGPLTKQEDKLMKGKLTQTEAKTDPNMYKRIVRGAIQRAADLGDIDSLIDELYGVRDNAAAVVPELYGNMQEEAQALLDSREKSSEWVFRARKLVDEYTSVSAIDDAAWAEKQKTAAGIPSGSVGPAIENSSFTQASNKMRNSSAAGVTYDSF